MKLNRKDLEEVVVLASQLQAIANHDTILRDETIDAIAEQTGIPETFIDQAHREVLQRRAIRQKWRRWGGVGLGGLVLVTALWWGRSVWPKDPQIVRARAEALRKEALRLRGEKSYSLALKKAQQAVRLDPQNVQAWNELGADYEKLGLLLPARENYLKAIELGGRSPDSVWAYYNMGSLLDEGSTKAEAIAYYRMAISVKPDHAASHNNLGWTLEQLGKYDEAIASYRAALKADPQYTQAKTNLRSLLAKLGRSE